MAVLVIRVKVNDYATWRRVFDRRKTIRTGAGLSNERVFRSVDDKNEVVAMFDTKDTKTAKDWANSSELKEGMKKSGVVDTPTFYISLSRPDPASVA
jgi:hypothetical protein